MHNDLLKAWIKWKHHTLLICRSYICCKCGLGTFYSIYIIYMSNIFIFIVIFSYIVFFSFIVFICLRTGKIRIICYLRNIKTRTSKHGYSPGGSFEWSAHTWPTPVAGKQPQNSEDGQLSCTNMLLTHI